MTARDLITDALEEIGAIAPGESLTDADAKAGFTRLNGMLDAWQSERLTIFNLNRSVFTFVANQASYTMGPGTTGTPALPASFVTTVRPTFIDRAAILFGSGINVAEIPLEVLTDDKWAEIRIKTVTSSLPTKVYYNATVPHGTLTYWPVPTDTTVYPILYLPLPMTRVATLDTELILAPAYEEALRYNLALKFCPPFGKQADPMVVKMATDGKALIKRANIRIDELKCDPGVLQGGASWNIFTGGM